MYLKCFKNVFRICSEHPKNVFGGSTVRLVYFFVFFPPTPPAPYIITRYAGGGQKNPFCRQTVALSLDSLVYVHLNSHVISVIIYQNVDPDVVFIMPPLLMS